MSQSFSLLARDLVFEHIIDSKHSPQKVWNDLSRAMKSSRDSVLWPSQSTVKGEGLIHNELIEVRYKFGISNPSYKYLLTVDDDNFTFSYKAFDENHPFNGGATIIIEERDGGSRLKWLGRYQTDNASLISRLTFRAFERGFFRELRRNLRDKTL